MPEDAGYSRLYMKMYSPHSCAVECICMRHGSTPFLIAVTCRPGLVADRNRTAADLALLFRQCAATVSRLPHAWCDMGDACLSPLLQRHLASLYSNAPLIQRLSLRLNAVAAAAPPAYSSAQDAVYLPTKTWQGLGLNDQDRDVLVFSSSRCCRAPAVPLDNLDGEEPVVLVPPVVAHNLSLYAHLAAFLGPGSAPGQAQVPAAVTLQPAAHVQTASQADSTSATAAAAAAKHVVLQKLACPTSNPLLLVSTAAADAGDGGPAGPDAVGGVPGSRPPAAAAAQADDDMAAAEADEEVVVQHIHQYFTQQAR